MSAERKKSLPAKIKSSFIEGAAGLSIIALMTAGCGQEAPKTTPWTSTATSASETPTPVITENPTPTATPEFIPHVELIGSANFETAEIKTSTYQVDPFPDVTAQIPQSTQQMLKDYAAGKIKIEDFIGNIFFPQVVSNNRRFVGLTNYNYYLVYDTIENKAYGSMAPDNNYCPPTRSHEQAYLTDMAILNASKPVEASLVTVTNDGKLIYEDYYDGGHSYVIADISKNQKTIIHNVYNQLDYSVFSEDTQTLLVSYPYSDDGLLYPKRSEWQSQWASGTFVLDLKNNKVITKFSDFTSLAYLSADGSNAYYVKNTLDASWPGRIGYFYNARANSTKEIVWPNNLTAANYAPKQSDSLKFLARSYGVFSASSDIDGQWGAEVRGPDGKFYEMSAKDVSLNPESIDDNGTIITEEGDVLKFNGSTFVLSEGPHAGTTVNVLIISN